MAVLQEAPAGEPQAIPWLAEVDRLRKEVFGKVDPTLRNRLGQFPTPMRIASYMASLFERKPKQIRLLDAGAGVGALTAAFVASAINGEWKPESIKATAFEIDPLLGRHLGRTLDKCGDLCHEQGLAFQGHFCPEDFIQTAVDLLRTDLWKTDATRFNCAILNPPYKKIGSDSRHRQWLREVGIETSNLYTAFLALTILLLEPGGELVAITPRSFCNGPYFKPFRKLLLREMSLQHLHVFSSRKSAFGEDDVLQENIIFYAVKERPQSPLVRISSSEGPDDPPVVRKIPSEMLVKPEDPAQFIHIVTDENGSRAAGLVAQLPCSLDEIGLSVSTGPVVDYRAREWLRKEPDRATVPLIYPAHFSNGWVAWPRPGHRKPNAYLVSEESSKWLIQAGNYVLTRRFSTKEERRRIVAAVFSPSRVPCAQVALENHVNYFHERGHGLSLNLARGLTAFLNSTVVDDCFRQFNGHTQVNAADLRNLRYPTRNQLEHLGLKLEDKSPTQSENDRLIEKGMDEWFRRKKDKKQR